MATIKGDRPQVALLVTDLDNTLWDWFGAWHASFSAMLSNLSAMSGVPQNRLEDEIRTVHRRRGTTEYSALLTELPSLQELHPNENLLEVYDSAIHVLNSERLRTTRLYPGVKETIEELRRRNVPVVAYTEAVAYWSEWRIKKTGLDGLISTLYTAPDHDLPLGLTVGDLRKLPAEDYGLKATDHRHTPKGLLKPDTRILRKIIADQQLQPDQVAYVGDSLMKDVAMAQQIGAHDVFAKYGVAQHRTDYELLRRVSHWTDDDIEREESISAGHEVHPSYTLAEGFTEILQYFDFKEA
ncbi:phosphoglycolate phosphatase [Nocardia otitidiscaviarum]|uniref:Phosphoglycolate phosphatase n=1 Tax=Nocardia otitidiscaviarum TaxID=1823 RepID=A0A378YB18_9NOCA|nr:HAD family hydrolase [Nocardia otitidiscaviarum]SUA74422.1 phosphoglycolate phosphatase [Nocardia otitidiscaviarum]